MKTEVMNLLVGELIRLVAIPSVSGEEGEILSYLENRLDQMGVLPLKQRVEGGWYNLIVNHRDGNKLLITAHVDTVPPTNGLPPRPEVSEEAVWGLGACDDKAGVAIILALISHFHDKLEGLPVTFALLVDEEEGGKGSEALVREISPPWGIVLEPTDLRVCHCEAGSIEIELITKGKMAHGSEVERGENAIDKAIGVIEKLKGLSFLGARHPMIGESLMNVLRISGGDGSLRIPIACNILIDLRILPGQDVEEAAKEVSFLLENEGVAYRFTDVSPPHELSEEEWIVQAINEAYKRVVGDMAPLGGMKSWTDAAHLMEGGVRPVVFGPGSLYLCHTPMERVAIQELWLAYKILQVFLEGLIRGGAPS